MIPLHPQTEQAKRFGKGTKDPGPPPGGAPDQRCQDGVTSLCEKTSGEILLQIKGHCVCVAGT